MFQMRKEETDTWDEQKQLPHDGAWWEKVIEEQIYKNNFTQYYRFSPHLRAAFQE